MMKCNHCGTVLPDDSNFCSACGKPPQMVTEIVCKVCGTKAAKEQRFCAKCGAQLAKQTATTMQNQHFKSPEPLPAQPAKAEGSLQYAGVLLRCLGGIFDAIVLFILGFFIALLTGQTTGDGFELYGFSAFVWWMIGFVYYAAFECKLGATPGKMVIGLRVIKTDGEVCDCKAAVIRTICRIIDNFFFIGVLIMLFSKRNQRFGDHMANTVVIKAKSIKFNQCKDNQFDSFND